MTVPPPNERRGVDEVSPASSHSWLRTVVLALLAAYGLAQVGLECHDLYLSTGEHRVGDPSLFGMPLDHESMLNEMSSAGSADLTGGYLIKGGYSPILEFISQLETAYALLWLVVLAFFLVIVAVLRRTGQRWPWLTGWLVVFAHLGAAACFGPYSSDLLRFHTISAVIPAGLLVTLAGTGRRSPVDRPPGAEMRPSR